MKDNLPVQAGEISPVQAIINSGQNFDVEAIGKMLEYQEKYDKMCAEKAYHKAMAAFKADPPTIAKDKRVSYNGVNYRHATLQNATQKINASLSAHGLSASWRMKQAENTITVKCTVTHEMGHSESTEMMAPPDKSGSKNAIQAIASTVTYLERYTLFAITGLAAHDGDDDGNGAGGPLSDVITADQSLTITDALTELGEETAKLFYDHYRISHAEDLPKGKYQEVQQWLKQTKRHMAQADSEDIPT